MIIYNLISVNHKNFVIYLEWRPRKSRLPLNLTDKQTFELQSNTASKNFKITRKYKSIIRPSMTKIEKVNSNKTEFMSKIQKVFFRGR